MTLRRLLLALVSGLLISCSLQKAANQAETEDTNQAKVASLASVSEQFSDKALLEQLRKEQAIERPFAWERWGGTSEDKGGTIVGIDQNGLLQEVDFVREAGQFVIKPTDRQLKHNVPITKSGDLDLTRILPDTEFPFESFVISRGGCSVHFIFAWVARNRSFKTRSVFLVAIDLRLIVERTGTIVSNTREELSFLTLDKTLTEDVNVNGTPDFLAIGSNTSTFLRIWTVAEDCAVRPLWFKQDDRSLDFVRGKEVSVSKNEASGSYDVQVIHYEPITKRNRSYFEITETVYRWDSIELLYKVAETRARLESSH